MDGKLKLGLGLFGSVALMCGAGYGHLEQRYELESGRVTYSWAVAKATGEYVIDVTPSWGLLKLFCSAGAIGLSLWCLSISYAVESLDKENRKVQSAQFEGRVEQYKLAQAAEIEAMKPVAEAVAQQKARDEVIRLGATGKVASLPPIETEKITGEVTPSQYQEKLPNFPKEFGELGKSAMIVGVGGSGKGMFVSHAGRAYRDKRPNALIWVIDLKADEREAGYWEGWPNKIFSKDIDSFTDPEHLLVWLETIIYKFRDLAHDGPKLLIFDEFLSGSKRSALANAKRHKYLVSYLESISSNGDSREISFWGIGQIANAADYGFSAGTRSMFTAVAIVYSGNKAASMQLLGTQFAPTDDKGEVLKMMDYSPVDRAIYWGPEGQWYPMPELHNYSGYNRDARAAA